MTVEAFREENPVVCSSRAFVQTPAHLQDCIRGYTAGAPEREGKWARCGEKGKHKLYPLGKTGVRGEPVGSVKETKEAGIEWWRGHIRDAERFLLIRKRQRSNVVLDSEEEDRVAFMRQRPKLQGVLTSIRELMVAR